MYWIWLIFTSQNEYLVERGLGLVVEGTDCDAPLHSTSPDSWSTEHSRSWLMMHPCTQLVMTHDQLNSAVHDSWCTPTLSPHNALLHSPLPDSQCAHPFLTHNVLTPPWLTMHSPLPDSMHSPLPDSQCTHPSLTHNVLAPPWLTIYSPSLTHNVLTLPWLTMHSPLPDFIIYTTHTTPICRSAHPCQHTSIYSALALSNPRH